jgi:hypothetical protein
MYKADIPVNGWSNLGDAMRLFRAKRTYVYIFCVYAVNALLLSVHGVRRSMPTHRAPLLSIVVPQVIGMLFLAALASVATRRTSSFLEKCVLGLTAIICLLFVAGVMHDYGYYLPLPLHSRSVFVAASCAAALLAGWRMLQIAGADGGDEAGGTR